MCLELENKISNRRQRQAREREREGGEKEQAKESLANNGVYYKESHGRFCWLFLGAAAAAAN